MFITGKSYDIRSSSQCFGNRASVLLIMLQCSTMTTHYFFWWTNFSRQ